MKVALIGDIGLFGRHTMTNERHVDVFSGVSRFLANHDLVIGNLETPMATVDKRYGGKSAYIKAKPADVEMLKYLNVSCVSLANNHIMDFGLSGLHETIETLESANIKYFGINNKTLELNVHGEDIRIFGYCSFDTNPEGMVRGKINPFCLRRVRESLKQANMDRKFPILSVHYGIEHRSFPSARYVEAFRSLADCYKFVLHGHHSHAFQPIEEHNESLLAYSLGNFCFDDVIDPDTGEMFLELRDTGRVGGIITVEVEQCKLRSWSVLPMLDNGTSLELNSPLAAQELNWIQDFFQRELSAALQYGDDQRREFIGERKAARNVVFYLKRLKPRYFRMLFFAKLNKIIDRNLVPFR